MHAPRYDWLTLVQFGVDKVASNLVAPAVRDVNASLITREFADRLRADGLDAARPLRVRRTILPRGDVFVFEQIHE